MVFENRDLGDENSVQDATGDSREIQEKRLRMEGRQLTTLESHLVRLRLGITAPPLSKEEAREIAKALAPDFRDLAFAVKESWQATQEENKARIVQLAVAAYQALLLTERK